MLCELSMENFKCFQSLTLSLGGLNVFTGLNGMGKSTVIQSLLVLKQSKEQTLSFDRIFLNSRYVSLGKGEDVLYEGNQREEIHFRLKEPAGNPSFRQVWDIQVQYRAKDSVLPCTQSVFQTEATGDSRIDRGRFESFLHGFEYLNAERLAPRTVYENASTFDNNSSLLGINGQYTAHYLAAHSGDIMKHAIPDVETATLRDALQFWMNQISPNVRLNITEIPHTDLSQLAYYYMEPGLPKSNDYRPTNVGFGISYALPIVTAALKAAPESILILENPEAHLHPRGQRKMGELLAWCANRGAQVFVETHSDHVLNGIRISVKKKQIPREAVRLFFFDKAVRGDAVEHFVQTPEVLEDGRLSDWPEGFFDEWEKAQDEILW